MDPSGSAAARGKPDLDTRLALLLARMEYDLALRFERAIFQGAAGHRRYAKWGMGWAEYRALAEHARGEYQRHAREAQCRLLERELSLSRSRT